MLAQGKLFFGSAMRFHRRFDVDNDPADVILEMPTKPKDYSAADALGRLSGLYAAAGKTLTVECVSPPRHWLEAPCSLAFDRPRSPSLACSRLPSPSLTFPRLPSPSPRYTAAPLLETPKTAEVVTSTKQVEVQPLPVEAQSAADQL